MPEPVKVDVFHDGEVHEGVDLVKIYKNHKRDVMIGGKKVKVLYEALVYRCRVCTEFVTDPNYIHVYSFDPKTHGRYHVECHEEVF